jgi:hypothetical protein
MKAKGGPDDIFSEVRHDSEPAEEGLAHGIKTRGLQTVGQYLSLEIDRCESKRARKRNARIAETLAFPCLCHWMVNFKNPQAVTEWVAVGICVQPCTEDYSLANPSSNSGCQSIVRKSRPGSDNKSHPPSRSVLLCLASNGLTVFSKDAQSQGIAEYATSFQNSDELLGEQLPPTPSGLLPQLHQASLTNLRVAASSANRVGFSLSQRKFSE